METAVGACNGVRYSVDVRYWECPLIESPLYPKLGCMEYKCIMHECVTTSTYSTRAKPEGCMYLWLRTNARMHECTNARMHECIILIQPSLGCIALYKVSADGV